MTNTTEAALRDALAIVTQIAFSDFPGRSYSERQKNAEKVIAALSQPSPASSPVGEVREIVAWLREQSEKGAAVGIAEEGDTFVRGAYGGASLVLKRAANMIESGEYRAISHSSVAVEAEDPCPVCGNEVRGQGGYLQCECPAVSIPLSKPTPVEAGLREAEKRGEQRAIARIVSVSRAIGWQAGVGGRETAGAIVSYLATSPDEIEPFVAGELSPLDFAGDWMRGGCLTWHAANGKVVSPEEAAALSETTPGQEGV